MENFFRDIWTRFQQQIFITYLRITNVLFVLKRVLKQDFLLLAHDSKWQFSCFAVIYLFTGWPRNKSYKIKSTHPLHFCLKSGFSFFFFFFLIWILRPFQEYFTYIEPIVHRRWAKTGEPGEKPPDHP